MVAWTAAIIIQHAVLAANPSSYHSALKEAQAEKRPLLVLVSAAWCPGCQTMKQSVIPAMVKRGELKSVTYTVVDYDADQAIAKQLLRTGSIPQLITFSVGPNGKWHREQLVGEADEVQIQSLITRALKAQQASTPEPSDGAIGN